MIRHPYLLFLGDGTNAVEAKTASGVAFWRPDLCRGQYGLAGGTIDLGLHHMSPKEAAANGAKTLLVGIANEGGYIPDSWLPVFAEALEEGLDIASGLHARLTDIPALKSLAEERGRALIDVRIPPPDIPVGSGAKRPGKRLLTVGTDCAVGKMYTVLALEKAMKSKGVNADFRATGQTGIFIAGEGIPIDAVVSDFIAGAAEQVSPANAPNHWDLIEGQGSLFHPAYAAVTLGLIHGSQPDAMILCHKAGLETIDGHPDYKIPGINDCIRVYEGAAKLTNPKAQVVALSINTSLMDEREALEYLAHASGTYQLPCFDPVRTGVEAVVALVESL